MNTIQEMQTSFQYFKKLRQDIHAHPELAFKESRTANIIADKLSAWGINVTEGIGGTGVVGTLTGKGAKSSASIGLRADMDALPMTEENTFSYASKYPGCMHGCGHDGHTVTLLAAAQYLAATRNFSGSVQFIFQPAEEANEIGSGAKAMIDDGLFDRFPVDSIFAYHNMPGMPAGDIAVKPGAMMAAMDLFDVLVSGKGTHGALPYKGIDTALICSELVSAWQSITSRNINPLDSVVLSATSIQVGETYNVIPAEGLIRGGVRTFSDKSSALVKDRFITLTQSLCEAYGAGAEITYTNAYPATINTEGAVRQVLAAASTFMPEERICSNPQPLMGSEDFAFMLKEVPGAYFWIGNGESTSAGLPCLLHDNNYDFNDKIIPVGATLFVKLVESILPIG